MATLPRVNRHLSHWSSQWNRLHLPHTYPGELVGGRIDRAAVRETQHGNHATQMCPLAHWATPYIQQTIHVTQRHSYLHQFRHKDSATASLQPAIWLFNTARHPTATVTHVTAIYIRLTAETWCQQFFRRLSNCDAPSQLISLVLVTATASLVLLGFEIRSRQAISIPKRMMFSSRRWDAWRIGLLIGEHLRYRYPPPGKRAMVHC